MARFREDERFKAVGPDSIILSFPPPSLQPSVNPAAATPEEGEIWFDWAFVDFWKSNYCEGVYINDQPYFLILSYRYRATRVLHGS